jgi:hypothetical protein
MPIAFIAVCPRHLFHRNAVNNEIVKNGFEAEQRESVRDPIKQHRDRPRALDDPNEMSAKRRHDRAGFDPFGQATAPRLYKSQNKSNT